MSGTAQSIGSKEAYKGAQKKTTGKKSLESGNQPVPVGSGDKAVVFQRARIGLESALIQKFDGVKIPSAQRPESTQAV